MCGGALSCWKTTFGLLEVVEAPYVMADNSINCLAQTQSKMTAFTLETPVSNTN
jgi:hypothetical protein